MHAVGIWCKTKIQIDPGGLEVNFSLQLFRQSSTRLLIRLLTLFPFCVDNSAFPVYSKVAFGVQKGDAALYPLVQTNHSGVSLCTSHD